MNAMNPTHRKRFDRRADLQDLLRHCYTERREATNPIRAGNRGTVRFSEHPDYEVEHGGREREERGCALQGYNYVP